MGDKMIKVYLASPYTIGDTALNVKRQIDMANELIKAGLAPFVPLYSHFQHMAHPRPYQDWINIDLAFVDVCDCLLRFGGESKGADGEVYGALDKGIPVFYNTTDLFDYIDNL
jgi:hypothetical protein